MFLERVNSKGMANNKYWNDWNWNKCVGTIHAMPNCTAGCVGFVNEAINPPEALSLFHEPYQRGGATPEAKDWMKYWKGETGIEPRVGGVCQWGGVAGHVAFVLETRDAGEKGAWIKVCESHYKTKLNNYKGIYFQVAEYVVKLGKNTDGLYLPYEGCCYTDVNDIRTVRDMFVPQVEVLTDSLNCRKSPNGAVYSGRRVPKGIYTIRDRKSAGGYVWACVEEGFWFALNDADGWTKTYEAEKMPYETLLNAYDILSQKYTDLVLRYEKETGKKA